MPRVTFIKDFDWAPEPLKSRVVIAYKKGMTVNVPTPCAKAAREKGAIADSQMRLPLPEND